MVLAFAVLDATQTPSDAIKNLNFDTVFPFTFLPPFYTRNKITNL